MLWSSCLQSLRSCKMHIRCRCFGVYVHQGGKQTRIYAAWRQINHRHRGPGAALKINVPASHCNSNYLVITSSNHIDDYCGCVLAMQCVVHLQHYSCEYQADLKWGLAVTKVTSLISSMNCVKSNRAFLLKSHILSHLTAKGENADVQWSRA